MLAASLLVAGISAAIAQAGGGAPAVLPAAWPPSTMQMTIASVPLTASDGKIYVNQNCEFFPDIELPIVGKKRPPAQFDSDVCHLEGVSTSEHEDNKVVGSELERNMVAVDEGEFVLQNITAKPAIFVVLVDVPKGWRVDSDPRPKEMVGNLAIFEVHAGPRETVRLHVGVRHTKELKPKALPGARP